MTNIDKRNKQQGEHTAALTMYENALRKSTGLSQSANPEEAEEGGGTQKIITLSPLFVPFQVFRMRAVRTR